MSVCQICEKKAKTSYKCKDCGSRYCSKCGDNERDLCEDCAAYGDGAMGGYRPEQEIAIGSVD